MKGTKAGRSFHWETLGLYSSSILASQYQTAQEILKESIPLKLISFLIQQHALLCSFYHFVKLDFTCNLILEETYQVSSSLEKHKYTVLKHKRSILNVLILPV